MAGWSPPTSGVPSAWGQLLNLSFVTYVADPEVSTGPVILFFLRDHLHRDVSVSYGFFRERPVVVTFHLSWEQHVCKHTRRGPAEARTHLEKAKVLAPEAPEMILWGQIWSENSFWCTVSTQFTAVAGAGLWLSGTAPQGTYSPFLVTLSEHDNNLRLLLEDHLPKVISGFRQWPLCGNILLRWVVSLKGKWQSCYPGNDRLHQMLFCTNEKKLKVSLGKPDKGSHTPVTCSPVFMEEATRVADCTGPCDEAPFLGSLWNHTHTFCYDNNYYLCRHFWNTGVQVEPFEFGCWKHLNTGTMIFNLVIYFPFH